MFIRGFTLVLSTGGGLWGVMPADERQDFRATFEARKKQGVLAGEIVFQLETGSLLEQGLYDTRGASAQA